MKLLDIVTLKENIGHPFLCEGDKGTIVHVHNNGEAFEVEFLNQKSGETLDVICLESYQLILHEEF